jgi:hypothetical protein
MKYATGGSTASTGKCYLCLVWWHFMQLDEILNPCYKAHSGSLIIHKVLIGAPAFHSDDRINLDKPLPPPFQERPRLGMRLYIRGTCKRFLSALVAELTNWVSTTRMKSAQLMKMLVILCEEHLTMEAHTVFPALIKAHKFAHDDKDAVLAATLRELFELLGRYILPEVYVYYILPRLRGDADVVAFGVDTPTRIVVMDFLQALLTGSKASMIVPHLDELVTTLTDPFVVPLDSPTLQAAATNLLLTVFQAVKGERNRIAPLHLHRLAQLAPRLRRLSAIAQARFFRLLYYFNFISFLCCCCRQGHEGGGGALPQHRPPVLAARHRAPGLPLPAAAAVGARAVCEGVGGHGGAGTVRSRPR